jgi:hypothetical protein
MNANTAALTARTDRRFPPPRRAFASNARLAASPLRSESQINRKEKANDAENYETTVVRRRSAVATPGALAALKKTGQSPVEFLARHVTGDWAELPVEDRTENFLSVERGFRVLSSYRTLAGERIWVITEADRSLTTLLLPDEY